MRDTPKKPPGFLLTTFVIFALAAGHVGAQDAAKENRAVTIEYMHYRHEDLEMNPTRPEQLGGIDDWAKGEADVRYLIANKLEFAFASLPKKPEVLIFKHSPLVKPPPNMNEKANPDQVGGGALDLIGPAVAFRHSHQRWPTNYIELSPLVEQYGGKAQARQYDRVDLTELPDGSLEIYSVAHGQTNRITLPFKE